MNSELEKVYSWFIINKLVLNVQKTHFMIFGNKNVNINTLRINNEVIKRSKSVKFLGVYIDEEMKWKSHVNNVLIRSQKT